MNNQSYRMMRICFSKPSRALLERGRVDRHSMGTRQAGCPRSGAPHDPARSFGCWFAAAVAVALLGLHAASANEPKVATVLGIDGSRFTIDGQPAFLLGISYYGALGASEETITADLDQMQRSGLRFIRVWATWAAFDNDVTAFDNQGQPREPFFSRLRNLVAQCDRRGMIVDITLTRGNSVVGRPRITSLQSHRRAVESLVAGLREHRNWYLDLGNERNIRDQRFVSFEELQQLARTAKQLDPQRLITASHAGDISSEDLRCYLLDVQVDLIAPHRPRSARSPEQTRQRTEEYLAAMRNFGRVVPVHYQEPFRRGFTKGWEPTVEDFLADLRGAVEGKAAGWCFHNGDQRHQAEGKPRRSFDLRDGRLFEQLDSVEMQVVRKLAEVLEKQ